MRTPVEQADEFLRFCAAHKIRPAYGEFGRVVTGGPARGHGRLLDAVSDLCAARGVPDLSLLVVRKGTTLPIVTPNWGGPRGSRYPSARTLLRKGVMTDADNLAAWIEVIRAEQARCFAHNWEAEEVEA